MIISQMRSLNVHVIRHVDVPVYENKVCPNLQFYYIILHNKATCNLRSAVYTTGN